REPVPGHLLPAAAGRIAGGAEPARRELPPVAPRLTTIPGRQGERRRDTAYASRNTLSRAAAPRSSTSREGATPSASASSFCAAAVALPPSGTTVTEMR